MQVMIPPVSPVHAPVSAESVLEDCIGRLAPLVRTKCRAILEAPDVLHGAVMASFAAWQATRQDLTRREADQRAREAADHRTIDGTPNPSTLASAETLAQCREREASRRRAHDEAQTAFATARALADRVEHLIRTTDVATLTPVEVTRARHKTPRTAAEDLARLRTAIAAVLAERRALETAPVPPAVARERLDAFLAAVASQYAPPLSQFIAPDFTPPASDEFIPFKLLSLLAALPPFRTVLHDFLAVEYQRMPTPVPPGERPAQLQALTDRLRRLETDEERVILEAAADGFAISRRLDCDAAVVATVVLVD